MEDCSKIKKQESSNINEVIRAVLNFSFFLQKDLAGTKGSKKHQKQQKAQKCNKEKAQNANSKQKLKMHLKNI